MGKYDGEISACRKRINKYKKQKENLKTAKTQIEFHQTSFKNSKKDDQKTIDKISFWRGPIFDNFCSVSGKMMDGEATYNTVALQNAIEAIQEEIDHLDDLINDEEKSLRWYQKIQ